MLFFLFFFMCLFFFFFFKQKTAYEISACLVGSEMCIRDSVCRVYTFIRRDGEKDSACQGLRNKNYPHYQRHAPYPPILLYKICNQRVNNRECDQHVPFNVRRGNESYHNQCSHICRLVLAVREVLEHVAKMVNRNEENRSKCYKPTM